MPPANLERVVVVGTTGSGKSTLAHQLVDQLRTRGVELDALYWGPKSYRDFRKGVNRLGKDEETFTDSIINGRYSAEAAVGLSPQLRQQSGGLQT